MHCTKHPLNDTKRQVQSNSLDGASYRTFATTLVNPTHSVPYDFNHRPTRSDLFRIDTCFPSSVHNLPIGSTKGKINGIGIAQYLTPVLCRGRKKCFEKINKAVVDIILRPRCCPIDESLLSIRRVGVAFALPIRGKMTSSTKPEVHNVLHCRQKNTEPRPR